MSDYFGHLVSRVFLHATAVQPRLPSLFEPHSRAEAADVEPDVTAASVSRGIHRLTAAQARGDQRFEDGPEAARVREAHVRTPRNAWAVMDSDVDSRAARPLERGAVQHDAELLPLTLPREHVRPAFDQDTAPIAAPRRAADSTVHASTSVPATPVSPGDPSTRHARAPRAPVADTPFARLDQPRPVLEPPATHPRIVATHFGSKPARPHAHSAFPRDEDDAEHTIHVTIGRVEIRAASAPPASRSSASASSAMTLGEYLRQRRVPGER